MASTIASKADPHQCLHCNVRVLFMALEGCRFFGTKRVRMPGNHRTDDMTMAEKLTMKALSGELDVLRRRLRKIETGFERKLENAIEKASEKLKARIEASEQAATGVRTHGMAVGIDDRRRMIAESAYLRAERRGFVSGSAEQDWLEAEMEIDQLLLKGGLEDSCTAMRDSR